jgi:LysR family transcriptional regulator, low CO2-responsive transcriptional regulator
MMTTPAASAIMIQQSRKHPLMVGTLADSDFAELPHLATFAAVAERGGFTAAAADLGVTQAAVSQRIAVLERELHVSLFDRRAGRISLSDAGQRLYQYARQILNLHGHARTDIGAFRPIVAGDLPLAASSVPGECFLPALLSAFHEKYPGVHVRATVGDSGSVLQDIEHGRASLGLVGRESENPSLEFRRIGSDTLVLVVAPGHRWAARKRIPLKALTGESLIIRERGSGSRCALEKSLELARTSLAGLNITLELGSNAAIKDTVKRGLGVAFLSLLSVQREIDAAELRAVTVSGLSLTRQFYLVYHRHRPLSPAALVFVNFLASHRGGHAISLAYARMTAYQPKLHCRFIRVRPMIQAAWGCSTKSLAVGYCDGELRPENPLGRGLFSQRGDGR